MGHLRTAVVAALVGACAAVGSAALAGTGIGDVFNLGQTNTVNGTSLLKGSTAGPQLQVNNSSTGSSAYALAANGASSNAPVISGANSGAGPGFRGQSATGVGVVGQTGGASSPAGKFTNTGGGPAGSFNVSTGVPPFTVNSSTLVSGLNSDQLDGYHANEILRGALAGTGTLSAGNGDTTRETVSITAPKAGFVLVIGSIVADDAFTSSKCNPCLVSMWLQVDSDVPFFPASAVSKFGNGTTSDETTLNTSWIFPVTAGAHTFTMHTAEADTGGPAVWDNPVLAAVFIPFGSTGSPTTQGTQAQAATNPKRVP